MMYRPIFICVTTIVLASCSASSTKEKINQVGDAAGQTIGQFTKGVAGGVSKSFDKTVELSPALQAKGLKLGKTTLNNDSSGTNHVLLAYVIFDQDLDLTLTAKAFDNKGLEMGRVTAAASGKKNEAKFIEFRFDKRTDIEVNSKLVIE
ncbi:MAG: hypothetical protein ACHQRM_06120 [Bacteroidia bacterium]